MNLFPHQVEVVEKFKDLPYSINAGQMGTGKSLAAVGCNKEYGSGLTLVTCPLAVSDMWADIMAEEGYETAVCDPRDRETFLRVKADVYVVHWQAVRLLQVPLQKRKWNHVIADEVQNIQNRKAQTTTALKTIKATHKSALSGTPITGSPDKYWSVLHWLDKKKYSSYWRYYGKYVEDEVDFFGYRHIKGPKNEATLLAEVEPFYIRHLKKDVFPNLPDKYYSEIKVDLHPRQRKAYDSMKKRMLAWVGPSDTLVLPAKVEVAKGVRLQQLAAAYCDIETVVCPKCKGTGVVKYDICMKCKGVGDLSIVNLIEPSSKVDALCELVGDNPGTQFVVFSQYAQLIKLAANALARKNIHAVAYIGDTAHDERRDNKQKFIDGYAQVFLGTIGAGGTGIDGLQVASAVVFLDRTWSPALNEQAEDRLHRYGQKNAVQVIDIIARDTIDAYKLGRVEMKAGWLRKVLGS